MYFDIDVYNNEIYGTDALTNLNVLMYVCELKFAFLNVIYIENKVFIITEGKRILFNKQVLFNLQLYNK